MLRWTWFDLFTVNADLLRMRTRGGRKSLVFRIRDYGELTQSLLRSLHWLTPPSISDPNDLRYSGCSSKRLFRNIAANVSITTTESKATNHTLLACPNLTNCLQSVDCGSINEPRTNGGKAVKHTWRFETRHAADRHRYCKLH